jgi:hypothetical protein
VVLPVFMVLFADVTNYADSLSQLSDAGAHYCHLRVYAVSLWERVWHMMRYARDGRGRDNASDV